MTGIMTSTRGAKSLTYFLTLPNPMPSADFVGQARPMDPCLAHPPFSAVLWPGSGCSKATRHAAASPQGTETAGGGRMDRAAPVGVNFASRAGAEVWEEQPAMEPWNGVIGM